MRIPRRVAVSLMSGAIATFAMAGAAAAATETVVVTDANATANGWQTQSTTCGVVPATGSQEMVEGPGSPPAGTGSREFVIGANGDSFETFRLSTFNGTALADLTDLNYSTYVQTTGSGGQAPYLILNVDLDGNGTTDDQLFFEPVYQTGTYGGDVVPDQGPVTVGEWQDWDALTGGWWSLNAGTFGPPLVTLATYIAAHSGAELTDSATLGSVRIATGCGGDAWAGFIGNADEFTIATASNGFTYDFEVLLINEPGDSDDCKNGGWETHTREDGSTFNNQGDCVSYLNTGKS